MSRPSRGFTVTNPRPAPAPTCPLNETYNFFSVNIDLFRFEAVWAPPVQFATYSAQIAINGGPFFEFESGGPIDSGNSFDWDLSAVASVGDTVVVDVFLSGAAVCPDIDTNSDQQTLTP